jgi:aldehyde dehydrogenase (NAD+)
VLIISPWNYPIQLLLGPLVGALAAGNTALLKPSEMAPHTAAALAELVPRYLDSDSIKVVEGGVPETTALLKERFDHIFFTGNGTVGRIVMRAAAEHLTPVTLELGGKSPCIVDRSVDLEVAAKRIAWAKFFNAGQSCTSVDYVLVHQSMEDALVHRLEAAVREFYGDDPKESPDFARIVNERHHQRLSELLSEGELVCGGETDAETRYIAPTIIRGVTRDMKVMKEEIFGPILPVVSVRDIDEAIDFVNAGDKPLALYVFSRSAKRVKRVLRETSSGGACINECIAHMVVPELPFGGVGESGMGAYHGRASFETFSHRKSVLEKSTKVDPPVRYPPYTDEKAKWMRRLL